MAVFTLPMAEKDAHWQLQLLGPFSLKRDGAEVRLSAAAQQLLALLALNGGLPFPRETLAAKIWPEAVPNRSRFYLRRTLVELRAAVGETLVASEESSLRLGTEIVRCDLLELWASMESGDPIEREQIVRPLLEGLNTIWLPEARELLSSRLTHGLLRLSNQHVMDGSEGEAVELLQLALVIEPLREQLWRALFRALAGSGNHAQIPAFVKTMRRRLASELGFVASPETEQLIDDLLAAPSSPSATPKAVLFPLADEPFVGRDVDLAEVEALLNLRFVTIVGVGGIGKTRLASFVAQKRGGEAFWFSMGYGSSVPLRVVLASQFRSSDVDAILFQRLSHLSALFVIDNAESLTALDRQFLADLFTACPSIQILVTSREPLGIREEHLYFLPPVALPGVDEQRSGRALDLFIAYLPKRMKKLSRKDVADIERICDVLGGVPLALKLAALKVRTLSPATVLAALKRDVRVIDSQTTEPLRSVQAAYEWSFARLSPEAQRLFTALSSLEGVWPEDLAFVVGGGPSGGGIFALEELLVAGLVLATPDHHYRSINPLRQFALIRSEEGGAGAQADKAVLIGFFEDLADRLSSGRLTPLRAHEQGLRFAAEQLMLRPYGETGSRVARLGRALYLIWKCQGDYAAGASWLDGFLSYLGEGSRPEMSEFLLLRGCCAAELYDLTGAVEFLKRGIQEACSGGAATELLFEFRHQLSEVYSNQGALKSAELELDAALEIAEEIGMGVLKARTLQRQAYIASERKEYETAHCLLDESLGIFLALGESEKFLSARETLAATLLNEHRLDEAELVLKDCDARRLKAGQEESRSWLLNSLAEIANRRQDPVAAIAYTEEAIAILAALGHDRKLVYSLQLQAQAYAQLGDDQRSIELLERVIFVTETAGMDAAMVLNLSRLAEIYERRGDSMTAKAYRAQASAVTDRVQSSGNWPNAAMDNMEVRMTSPR